MSNLSISITHNGQVVATCFWDTFVQMYGQFMTDFEKVGAKRRLSNGLKAQFSFLPVGTFTLSKVKE